MSKVNPQNNEQNNEQDAGRPIEYCEAAGGEPSGGGQCGGAQSGGGQRGGTQTAAGGRAAAIARRVLDVLCVVSGVFFVGIYLPYFFFHVTKGHKADVLASLLVFAGVLLPFLFRKLLKRITQKFYLPLKCLWCFVMCFYMVSFSVFAILVTGHDDVPVKTGGPTAVIVFGCQIHDEDWLSIELTSRLNKAAQVLETYPDALCVTSGGKGADEPVSEAYAMKKYLVEKKNIDPARIIMEDRSTDTAENVRYALELLKNEGFDLESGTVIGVSSEFHTPRVQLFLERAGAVNAATVSAVTPLRFNRFVYTVREYMSYIHYWIFG